MNKQILAQMAAARVGITVRDSAALLTAVLEVVQEELLAGRAVPLSGIGVLEPVRRAAREMRNPRTGEPVRVPERTAIRFRASRPLLDRINRDADDGGR